VLNLSLGAPPTASAADDPLCQAVERAARAGLVVVASAGNYGQTEDGRLVFASITSPGISPYAITVGALRTQGTVDPSDDEVAPWSSKGPTLVDHLIKPDLVAPGSRIVSTAAAGSALVAQFPDRVIDGPGARDYFVLSGTSMAAAVVSGAAALVLEGQPRWTPLQVKLALQASAEFLPAAGLLAGGAGRLDLEGLGEDSLPKTPRSFAAYAVSPRTENGTHAQIIVWGSDIIVWGSSSKAQDIIVWGSDIIVWGSSSKAQDIIVWGSDIIVWGSSSKAQDIIVWGSDIIVWGSSSKAQDIIVWGSSNPQDIIVWAETAALGG
jgi:serine protease AprX